MDLTARLPSPAVPLIDPNTGVMAPAWFQYFLALFQRTGGAEGQSLAGLVKRTGDTMLGPLILSADPATALAASTKQYVDATQTVTGSAVLGFAAAAGAYVKPGIWTLVAYWPWPYGTVTSLVARCPNGAFTAGVRVAGVLVPGLTGTVFTGGVQQIVLAGANQITAGQSVELQLSSIVNGAGDFGSDFDPGDFGASTSSPPTDVVLQVNYLHGPSPIGGFSHDFSTADFVVA